MYTAYGLFDAPVLSPLFMALYSLLLVLLWSGGSVMGWDRVGWALETVIYVRRWMESLCTVARLWLHNAVKQKSQLG